MKQKSNKREGTNVHFLLYSFITTLCSHDLITSLFYGRQFYQILLMQSQNSVFVAYNHVTLPCQKQGRITDVKWLLINFISVFFYFPGHQDGYPYGCVSSHNPEHLWCDLVYTFIMDSGGSRNPTSLLHRLYLLLLCKCLMLNPLKPITGVDPD